MVLKPVARSSSSSPVWMLSTWTYSSCSSRLSAALTRESPRDMVLATPPP